MSKNHKIINLMVFCLAVSSCSWYKNNTLDKNKQKQSVTATPPAEFDWDNATAIDAFKAGKIKSLEEFAATAPHITDTIIINKDNYQGRVSAGTYFPWKDQVHLKYFIPDLTGSTPKQAKEILRIVRKWNSDVLKMVDKTHEYHHRYIYKKGVFDLTNSAEDYARLCAHNEIAAFTSMLLYEREVVKKAIAYKLPPSVWRKIIGGRFSKYWDAVEEGKVNLDNVLLNDEKKDNLLISTVVFDWWMKNEYYKNTFISIRKVKNYLSQKTWAINYSRNQENYEKALDICYTFIKDGKVINLNRFYRRDITQAFGHKDLPMGTEYQDIENQPQVKKLINKFRNKPEDILETNIELYKLNEMKAGKQSR